MADLTMRGIVKRYGAVEVIHGVDLDIADGEFVVFVGPSGCGKTSALRMIAGLEDITAGTVRVGGKVVNDLPPKARDMAMIFQNYALYPHMNAYDNMAFGLKMRGLDRSEIRRRVESAARILGLSDVLKKRPRHLSGGQRQRVAMGRAIVRQPQVFLMDEPLSNLDAKLRVQMRADIAKLQRELGVTTVYVTHDQVEAMTMGDRVAVMSKGVLQQVDAPQRLYDRPASRFVGSFIGSPGMNFFDARLVSADGGLAVDAGFFQLPFPTCSADDEPPRPDQAVTVGVRPEDLTPEPDGTASGIRFGATVDLIEPLGSDKLVHCIVQDTEFIARVDPRLSVSTGDQVTWSAPSDRLHIFDATSGLRLC